MSENLTPQNEREVQLCRRAYKVGVSDYAAQELTWPDVEYRAEQRYQMPITDLDANLTEQRPADEVTE